MRDVAIVSFAQTTVPRAQANDAELVMEVVTQALGRAQLDRHAIGFCCSGSSDYLTGAPFSFVGALDAVGAWPPIQESHVEMDGAWALYEAWVRLLHGDIDTALVYAFGRSSLGDLEDVLVQQLDPYYLAPLGVDPTSLAGLQARALVDAGLLEARALDELRPPPVADGAAAIVLATGDRARALAARPAQLAWIRGIDHRIEPHSLGARDLLRSSSTALAGQEAGASDIEIAELHAPFAHERGLIARALGLDEKTTIHASAAPLMVAGLGCVGRAAQYILDGKATRTLGHATSGACLQQNLVCVLEARP
jgi:acetyl-CoA acetyltransferase